MVQGPAQEQRFVLILIIIGCVLLYEYYVFSNNRSTIRNSYHTHTSDTPSREGSNETRKSTEGQQEAQFTNTSISVSTAPASVPTQTAGTSTETSITTATAATATAATATADTTSAAATTTKTATPTEKATITPTATTTTTAPTSSTLPTHTAPTESPKPTRRQVQSIQPQWDYNVKNDSTPDQALWSPNSRKQKHIIEAETKAFREFAQKFECLNNVWCDTWYDEKEGDEFQRKLWERQHPADCTKANILYWNLHYSGMGSILHTVAVGLAIAYNTNRTLVIQEPNGFASENNCGPKGMLSCYLQPITSCNSTNWGPADSGNFPDESAVNKRILFINDRVPCHYSILPEDYKHKGVFWWKAQSARYLSRPRQSLINFVDEQKKTIFKSNNGEIPHPIISIHVRHGDKHTEANIFPLKDYMTAALKIKQKTGVSNIFLSTEDEAVVSQAINEYSSEFNIYYQPIPRLNISPFYSQQELGPTAEALIAYTSLFVGLECDVMIGTRSSNFCRWMDELRKVFGKARIPYYSIDYYGYEVDGWWSIAEADAKKLYNICGVTANGQPTLYDGNLISSGLKPSPRELIIPKHPVTDAEKYLDLFRD